MPHIHIQGMCVSAVAVARTLKSNRGRASSPSFLMLTHVVNMAERRDGQQLPK